MIDAGLFLGFYSSVFELWMVSVIGNRYVLNLSTK